ncbi:MAG: 4Fe-4S dicluster domain-containing protein [Candidatus Caldarchaeum sp.]|nr:4Fe-4S dicluster domain-containing protein [Candidatus Caldarchaeum sp.]
MTVSSGSAYYLDTSSLALVIEFLRKEDYVVVGPVVRDGAVMLDEISSVSELPRGWKDSQGPGIYRLEKRGDNAFFGFLVGPQSIKKFLIPPRSKLLTIYRNGRTVFHDNGKDKLAFVGMRSCDLTALQIFDKIFLHGPFVDPVYASNRRNVFVVAVNCTEPGENCFCLSMNTGPKALKGYDISLTEVIRDRGHYFVAYVGSEKGENLLKKVGARPASEQELNEADELVEKGKSMFRKSLDTNRLKELIYDNVESPVFSEVAERCLACANCTLVCPTCFCNIVEDVTFLDGGYVERWRRMDSCFTADFSYIHGGSIRGSRMSRYRQWFLHKLATWVDQFGMMGCVGCGRCITWCPVGIDITEEAAKIRRAEVVMK